MAGIFGYLADRDFRGYSPLYEHLARHIAADDAIPALVTGANRRNHAPILFFACVHDLVLRDPTLDLARAYQSVADGADPDAVELWPRSGALVADRARRDRRPCCAPGRSRPTRSAARRHWCRR